MNKISIRDIKNILDNKRVLIRVDFNVPIQDGTVKEPYRIIQTLPTIDYVLNNGARSVIIISHLGRPNGIKNMKYSLRPVVDILQKYYPNKVDFLDDCVGDYVIEYCMNVSGRIVLLENLRFHMEEEVVVKQDNKSIISKQEDVDNFRAQLSKLGDIFVNDAFGNCHRNHSSMIGISIPIRVVGLLIVKEMESFNHILQKPNRPFFLLMGGAKIKDKIGVINKMIDKIDELVIGGGIAITMLYHMYGMKTGNSLNDKEASETVKEILKLINQKGVKLHLPVDFLCSDKPLSEQKNFKVFKVNEGIDEGWSGYDVGPETCKQYNNILSNAKTVFWNGPFGAIEYPEYATGSIEVLQSLCNTIDKGSFVVIGGGETVIATKYVKGSLDKISHISTGGGVALELLEGKELPGIKYIQDK